MTRYLLCVAVLLGASAQAQYVEPCGGVASCVRVGTPDGGQVQLGGAVQTSRYALPDGGYPRVRIQPLSPLVQTEVVGNQTRLSANPDVVIGGLQARDGGTATPIVSVRTATYEVLSISSAGIASNTPTSGPLGKFDLIDAGNVNVVGRTWTALLDAGNAYVNVNLGIGGTEYVGTVDAGAGFVANNLGVGGTTYTTLLDAGAATIANNLTVGGTVVGGTRVDLLDAGAVNVVGALSASGTIQLAAKTADSATAPTVTACAGGGAASITSSNGTGAFVFDVGTSCASESTAVLTFPAATTGWLCACSSTTADRVVLQKVIPPANATTVTMQNIVISTGANGDWTDNADVGCICRGD